MIAIGQEQRLGIKTYHLILYRKSTAAIILLVIAAGLVALHAPAVWILATLIVTAVLFIIGMFVAWLDYRSYTFTLGEFDLVMKRGILSQRQTSLPYRQVQSVDIVRDISHRMFGTSRLVIITAGHEEPDAKADTDTVFDPMDKEIAEEIRQVLERKIGVQVVEGETSADKEEKKEEGTPAAPAGDNA